MDALLPPCGLPSPRLPSASAGGLPDSSPLPPVMFLLFLYFKKFHCHIIYKIQAFTMDLHRANRQKVCLKCLYKANSPAREHETASFKTLLNNYDPLNDLLPSGICQECEFHLIKVHAGTAKSSEEAIGNHDLICETGQ